jgi:hypothetical protein
MVDLLVPRQSRVNTELGGRREVLLQDDCERSSEGSSGGRLPRPHDTHAVEVVAHHVSGHNCERHSPILTNAVRHQGDFGPYASCQRCEQPIGNLWDAGTLRQRRARVWIP